LKKKTLILALVAVFCLALLSGCSSSASADQFTYKLMKVTGDVDGTLTLQNYKYTGSATDVSSIYYHPDETAFTETSDEEQLNLNDGYTVYTSSEGGITPADASVISVGDFITVQYDSSGEIQCIIAVDAAESAA